MSNRQNKQPSLSALSFVLRHRKLWPPTFHGWHFSNCATCAMGLASALWPDRIKEPGVNYMEWAFKIPSSAASKIFCYMPEGHCDVTPESVADRIDRYLADPLNA